MTRPMCRLAAVLTILLLARPAGAAGIDPEVIRLIAGYWFLAAAATGAGCNLRLGVEETIGGHAVEAPAGCRIGGQPADDIAAWNLDGAGGIVFLDPVRHVLFRLEEQEYGDWTAEGPDGGYVLRPSEEGVVALPVARDLAASWVMRRPDGPVLCRLRLDDRPPPGGEESFGLTVAPGCDPLIAGFRFASWRIEGAAVILYGEEGRSLAFLRDGTGGLVKAPREGGKPLVMERAP